MRLFPKPYHLPRKIDLDSVIVLEEVISQQPSVLLQSHAVQNRKIGGVKLHLRNLPGSQPQAVDRDHMRFDRIVIQSLELPFCIFARFQGC